MGVTMVHDDFGTALALKGGYAPAESVSALLEGCQSVTEELWPCDYRAERLRPRKVETVSEGGHLLSVLWPWLIGAPDTYLDVLGCSTSVTELWGSGLRDAHAWSSALTSCPQDLMPLDITE